MARFRGTLVGRRGEASRLGDAETGLVATCNGWDVGVRVEAHVDPKDGADELHVFMTRGSNAKKDSPEKKIGVVRIIAGQVDFLSDLPT